MSLTDFIYDVLNYFKSDGIESATDLVKYDFGAVTDIYRITVSEISFAQETATFTVSLSGDAVDTVTVNNTGSGYNNAVLSITGDGSGATLSATVDTNGAITAVAVTAGGSGYTTASVSISYDSPAATVSSYVSVDDATWVKIADHSITTTPQDIQIPIDSSIYRYFKLAYVGGIKTYLKIFSMLAYDTVSTNTQTKLASFVFNLEQKYVLVLNNEQIKIFADDVLIKTVSATGLDSDYFDKLKFTQAEDTMIFTHPDLKTKQLVRSFASEAYTNDPAAGDDIVLSIADTGIFTVGDIVTVSSSAGRENATITVVTTDVSITVDTLALNHTTVTPLVTSNTVLDWTFSDFPFINIPVDDFGETITTNPAQTLTPSEVEGSIKLTAGGAVFSADSVGQLIDGGGGRVRITEYKSATVVYGYTIIPFYTTDTIASTEWDYIAGHEAVWSATRGYPTTCMFYQQRLWFGGSKSKPNTLWASRVGQYNNFENLANYDNDAISATISSTQIDEIVNIYPNRGIQIFTAGAEWVVPEGATTPDTITFAKNTSNGSLNTISPVDISGVTLFVEKNGKNMLDFVYSDGQASYVTTSMSLLTDIIDSPVGIAVDYNSNKDVGNFLYMVMADGTMAVWCILLDQKIVSPVRFESSGLIKDVVEVAGDIYLLVSIDYNLFLEKLSTTRTDSTVSDDTLSEVISGLENYNGKTVRAYTDTVNYGFFVPSNGSITLPSTPTETVYIGYDYTYALTSTKIAVNGQTENIEKRIAKSTIATLNTPKLTFCGQTIEQTDDVYDFYSVTGFSRDCRFTISGTFDRVEILSIFLNINYGSK